MSSHSSLVAKRYVKALVDLAQESKALDSVDGDFKDLGAMVASSDDLQYLIRSPLIAKDKQIAAIDALSAKAKFHTLTANFLRVLVQNRRLNILEGVLKAFGDEVSKRRGEVSVTVETAQDLNAKQIKALQDVLKKQTGKDIAINAKVEPAILGGMIVTVGSQMIDDSVRRKLEKLKAAMGKGSNENANSTLSEVS